MRLYLIRHGESSGNQEKLIFGSSDHPLTANGIKQAEEVREKLRDISISHCYTSTLQRAFHTADICFGDRNIPIERTHSLREQHMGIWEDRSFEYLSKHYPEEFTAMMTDWTVNTPLGGESFDDVYRRVVSCVDSIIMHGEDSAIVAHNGPLSMITTYLLNIDRKCADSFYFFHGCYSVIAIDNGYKKHLNTLEAFNK